MINWCVCNEATQCRLLTEHDLTYQKALDIAKGTEAADSNTILKTREPPINNVLHQASPEQRGKTVTAVVKQDISRINGILKMHIVMLVAKKGIFFQCTSPHRGRSLLRRKYINSPVKRS